MPVYPIKLSAAPNAWRLFMLRKADPSFAAFGKKIFERDNYTCQFCAFRATNYQEVINLDQNYNNNQPRNLVTACCFCAQCFFIESIGKQDYGGGTIIYLPKVTQNDLNALCHILFQTMANATDYQNEAQNLYRSLTLGSKVVEKILSEGMSDPALLGRMIIDAYMEDRIATTEKILKHLRLLPSRDKFNTQILAWASTKMFA